MSNSTIKFNLSEEELNTKMRNSKTQEIIASCLGDSSCGISIESNESSSLLIFERTLDSEKLSNIEFKLNALFKLT
jgi:hypothetical protein